MGVLDLADTPATPADCLSDDLVLAFSGGGGKSRSDSGLSTGGGLATAFYEDQRDLVVDDAIGYNVYELIRACCFLVAEVGVL